MPAFTHVLGPLVSVGRGKLHSRLLQRYGMMLELIDHLPRFDHFMQVFDPKVGDVPAFQEHGFEITPQYTFRVDCRSKLDDLWGNLRDKTRNVIRRAGQKYTIEIVEDPERFIHLYLANLEVRHQSNWNDFSVFPDLFAECKARNCAELLGALK